MKKTVKVLNHAGMPVENLYVEVEHNSFISSRNGDLELKAENPDSVVRINYVGSPEVRTTFGAISDIISVDNGFRKKTCSSKNMTMDYLTKQIQIVDKTGNPLPGVEVFSESGLTNTLTDTNGMALIKVNDPDEYLNFDGENIEGEAISFLALKDQVQLGGYSTAKIDNKPKNASVWWLGLIGLGLLWNHSKNQKPTKKTGQGMKGMNCPVKITL